MARRLRIVSVDMNGFCGRDFHPEPAMVGELVTVERSYLDGPDGEDAVRVFETLRANGSRVDLVEFEVEELEDEAPAAAAFVIACRVSGGVTGTRQSFLKRDGAVQTFAGRAEAEALAARLASQANGPYARAYFEYWVEEARS